LTDITGEDLFAGLLLGICVKLSALTRDIAISAGLDGPLTLGAFILLAILIATNHPWRSN